MLATEPDAFDCATCERRIQTEALDDANREAWGLWLALGTRFVKDYGLGRWVIERACEGQAQDDIEDLVARLSVIYDTLCPLPQGPQE